MLKQVRQRETGNSRRDVEDAEEVEDEWGPTGALS